MSDQRVTDLLKQLSPKELRALKLADSANSGGLYPGIQWDFARKRFARLRRLGLVEFFYPHNPVHKERALTTNLGRLVLEAASEPVR